MVLESTALTVPAQHSCCGPEKKQNHRAEQVYQLYALGTANLQFWEALDLHDVTIAV